MSKRLDAVMNEWREQIDARLEKIIDDTLYPDEFKAVLKYALFPGGKRLRPILCLAWHQLFSDIDEYALNYACGIELLHSYSLIHDDMPCMDDDDMRRGKPSVHKQFGEGMALLAGDALMDLAYRILYTPSPRCEKTPLLGVYAPFGDNGLICGQYYDLFEKAESLDDLLKIHACKTGALISFACTSGAELGKCLMCNADDKLLYSSGEDCAPIHVGEISSSALDDAEKFGKAFGVAFQLYDDVSEYIDGEKIGPTNIMKFLDLSEAKAMLFDTLNDAAKSLEKYGDDGEILRQLLDKFVIA